MNRLGFVRSSVFSCSVYLDQICLDCAVNPSISFGSWGSCHGLQRLVLGRVKKPFGFISPCLGRVREGSYTVQGTTEFGNKFLLAICNYVMVLRTYYQRPLESNFSGWIRCGDDSQWVRGGKY